jgi:hypothetical protein
MPPELFAKAKRGGIFRKGVWGGKNGDLWEHYPEWRKPPTPPPTTPRSGPTSICDNGSDDFGQLKFLVRSCPYDPCDADNHNQYDGDRYH